MADRIQLRRDTAANWTQYNPILLEGEPGIELDTDQWKLGDGIHTWSQLAYRGGEVVQQKGQSTTVAMSQKAVTDLFNSCAQIDSFDSDSDFDICDENGYVIEEFKDGHIRTKNFDSRKVSIIDDTGSDSDFDICDENGYVIAEFKDGHIRTKNFDSREGGGGHYLDLQGKNVLFFGDSITYYKEYVNSFTTKTGCNPYNRGLGSSCISNGGTGVPSSFCSRVDMTPDNRQDGAGMAIGMPNNVDIDIVIIEGGINDFGYTNSGNKNAFLGDIGVADSAEIRQSFYGGIKYVISRIKTLYPNALVCVLGLIPTYSPIAFPNWSMVTLSDTSNILSTLTKKKTSEDKTWFDYNEALEKTALQFGALFISLENMGMNPLITSDREKYYKDGLHPNNAGGELIANRIINTIIKH